MKQKSNSKCVDCIGFCNFGKYPNCKPTCKKDELQKRNRRKKI
jgi:hypothetical protein